LASAGHRKEFVLEDMNLEMIVAQLDAPYTCKLPKRALREAQRRGTEMVPRLIDLLKKATATIQAGEMPSTKAPINLRSSMLCFPTSRSTNTSAGRLSERICIGFGKDVEHPLLKHREWSKKNCWPILESPVGIIEATESGVNQAHAASKSPVLASRLSVASTANWPGSPRGGRFWLVRARRGIVPGARAPIITPRSRIGEQVSKYLSGYSVRGKDEQMVAPLDRVIEAALALPESERAELVVG
jgi:hypothetical protein